MAADDRPLDLDAADYDRFEDDLLSSPRGRAFLRMRDRRSRVVAVEDVRRLLGQRTAPEADPQSHIRILRRELQELSSHIAQTRREIAALRPDDPSANRIMLATEELDAILQATEHATTEILNGAERIQAVADRLRDPDGELAGQLDNEVMGIMTACSFQDITGQRMTKVVNTMRYIERRVNAMIEIWGGLDGSDAPAADEPADKRPDAHLLNGPALHGGINQDVVDALLSGQQAAAAAAPAAPAAPDAGKSDTQTPADEGKPTVGPLSQSAVDDLFP
ncbi:protein phosphatase CheZ [Rhodospirillum centenum]|uniref:Chemotaxis protein CheZ, putative n=1 Tax=Rhodospirillum centenum (strain ATCC 51521 / SW) TaxID=414684 RepID=B6ISE4_RHOCS|nr:protein phosphatase CheZ [Rhodospirillum centenum]ACI98380.1 chemotaxis protein CheZ, putative [Rhodospirillum centenum SW]